MNKPARWFNPNPHAAAMRLALLMCGMLVPLGAMAQSNTAADDEEIEEVIITGSHIRGIPADAISPVETLTREDLVQSGASDFGEVVRNLNVAAGSDTAVVNLSRFNGLSGTGLTNVALRGLGPTSTLVLMNSKRLPFVAQKLADGDRFVDISSIPIAMIDRLEVLKDGGSAIYGSDAIAGIVNFILRDDFEGLELTARSQNVSNGGEQHDNTISGIWGWASNSGASNLVIAGDIFVRSGQKAIDRADLYLRTPRQDSSQPIIAPNLAWGGANPAQGRPFAGDPQCAALGYARDNITSSAPNFCYRRDAETTFSIPEVERNTIMVNFKHDFGGTELNLSYSNVDLIGGQTQAQFASPIESKLLAPSLLGSSSGLAGADLWGRTADPTVADNPLTGGAFVGGPTGDGSILANGGPLPAAAIPGVPLPLELVDFELRIPGVDASRQFDFTGTQAQDRFQLGVSGEFGSQQIWHWDVSLMQGSSNYRNSYLGVDKNRLERALFGLGGPNCTPNGRIIPDASLGAEPALVAGALALAADPTALGAYLAANAANSPVLAEVAAAAAVNPAAALGPLVAPDNAAVVQSALTIIARNTLAGSDGLLQLDAEGAGAVGPLEAVMLSFVNEIPRYPLLNMDNLVLAMTSSNQGTEGCEFFNPFLTRHSASERPARDDNLGNSEELIRWLEVPIADAHSSTSSLTVVDFAVSTSFSSGIDLAVGIQNRSEGRETEIHPQILGGVNSFGMQAGAESFAGLSENLPFDRSRDIIAAFTEVQVPLRDDLRMQVALRYEDYGGQIGNSLDPKVSLRYQLRDNMILRGSIGTSFRGPSLAQIEEGTGYSIELGIRDRLGRVAAEYTGVDVAAVGRSCVRTGYCDPIPDDQLAVAGQSSIVAVKQGRATPNLQPETATTFNIGWVMTPQDGRGLGLGVDFYMIDFADKIIDVPTQSFLETEYARFLAAREAEDFAVVDPTLANFGMACDPSEAQYRTPDPNGNFEDCQVNPASYRLEGGAITRRPDTTRSLQIISGPSINTGQVLTSGIDFNFSYGLVFERAGTLSLNANVTNILNYDVSDFPVGLPDYSASGFTNNSPDRRLTQSLPDLKATLNALWSMGSHSYFWSLRYVGEYTDDDAQRLSETLGPYQTIDFRYSYGMTLGDDSGRLDLSAGVIDLLDADLPATRSRYGTDVSAFDTRGQRYYIEVSWKM